VTPESNIPPPEITQWLGRLFVLHGVPFSYLIAKPALLEPESIRLFYLDSAWIAALLDGALSLARSSMTPFFLQRAMAGEYLQVQPVPADPPEATGTGKPSIVRHLTGFLMRSQLVSGWRGVKIVAYSTSKTRLELLRMERVGDDVLLCICNGQLGRIEFTEPPHAVHFGVREIGKPTPRAGAKALGIAEFAGTNAVTEFVERMLARPKHAVLDIEHSERVTRGAPLA
jgi:hypothetical protein